MPNGHLVIVHNPNVEINNPSYVVAQQPVIPQTVQYTTQTQAQTIRTVQQVAQQSAVQQPIPQQNDLPPSYDNVWES